MTRLFLARLLPVSAGLVLVGSLIYLDPEQYTDSAPSGKTAGSDSAGAENPKIVRSKSGPIRHESLPKEMIKRITAIRGVFTEVDLEPVEDWIDDLKRSEDPGKEIVAWEARVRTYQTFTAGKDLPVNKKVELYGIILFWSKAPAEKALRYVKMGVSLFTEQESMDIRGELHVQMQKKGMVEEDDEK